MGAAAAAGTMSDLPGIGQRVVSDLSQDVDGLSWAWADAHGLPERVAPAPARASPPTRALAARHCRGSPTLAPFWAWLIGVPGASVNARRVFRGVEATGVGKQ